MDIVVTNCGSSLSDTYMYLLDTNGNTIEYNDDYSGMGACSNTYHSVIKKTLSAGTYYAVSEGYNSNGSITTNITGTPTVNNTTGNTFQNPIVAGPYNSPFTYSNSQNTANFTNTYGQSSNDVFYKFTLSVPMVITIKHCGSSLSDTYLHLLDASGTRIAYNDDYNEMDACFSTYNSYLWRTLSSGTYYIVSEGHEDNGVILTSVIGTLPQISISYSYDASGNRIARQLPDLTASAAPMLRSSGIDAKKEAAIPDPGRDGSKDKNKQPRHDNADGVKNRLQTVITVYPNPTDGLLTVNLPDYKDGKTGEIRLYDSTGRNLYTRKIGNKTETIDLSGYVSGIYMAVISMDGETTTHKVMKVKK